MLFLVGFQLEIVVATKTKKITKKKKKILNAFSYLRVRWTKGTTGTSREFQCMRLKCVLNARGKISDIDDYRLFCEEKFILKERQLIWIYYFICSDHDCYCCNIFLLLLEDSNPWWT